VTFLSPAPLIHFDDGHKCRTSLCGIILISWYTRIRSTQQLENSSRSDISFVLHSHPCKRHVASRIFCGSGTDPILLYSSSSSCWGASSSSSSKKAQSSVVSNRIWVKFSRNVLNANTRRMTETFSSIWRHNFKMEEMTSLYASIVLWGWSEKEGVIGYKMCSRSRGQGAIAPPKNTGARVSFRSSIILARHCWLIHKRLQKACTKMHRFACKISKLLQVEHPTRPSKLERMPSLDRSSSPLHRLPLLQINSDLRHRIQVTESTHCTLL